MTKHAPTFQAKAQLAGYYRMVATKPDGSSRVVMDWTPNLITDIGMDKLGTNTGNDSVARWCRVGTSSTAPTEADEALGAQVASSNTIIAKVSAAAPSSPYYCYVQQTWRFGIGVATGNLNEVGVGWASSGSTLFSRALTTDGLGTPTTITVLADEILDVTYELRAYLPTADFTDTINVESVDRDIVLRAARATLGGISDVNFGEGFRGAFYWNAAISNAITYYSGDAVLGAVTASPTASATAQQTGNVSVAAYVDGNYYLDATYSLGLGDANLAGGIGAVQFQNNLGGWFQFSIDPPLAKTVVKYATFTVRVSWDRRP